MKNNSIKQTVSMIVEKTANLELKRTNSRWQTFCIGLLHQPKRPKM